MTKEGSVIKWGRREFLRNTFIFGFGTCLDHFWGDPPLVFGTQRSLDGELSERLNPEQISKLKKEGKFIDFNAPEWDKKLSEQLPRELCLDWTLPENPRQQLSSDCGSNVICSLAQAKYVFGGDQSWRMEYPTRTLNPAFIISKRKNFAVRAVGFFEMAEILKQDGVCVDSVKPDYYSVAQNGLWEYAPTTGQSENALFHKIEKEIVISYSAYPGQDCWKAYLKSFGPFYLSFTVFENIYSPKDFVLAPPHGEDQPLGVHALLVTGWDDVKLAFKVRNCWGAGWGNNGNAYLSYDYFKAPIANYFPHLASDVLPIINKGNNNNVLAPLISR